MVHVKFRISGQGPGEYERGGALQRAAKRVGGTGGLESQGPPGLTARADLGKLHRARRLRGPTRDARHDPSAGEPELADTPSLVHHAPGGWFGIKRAERPERERPLPPGLEATTGAARQRFVREARAAAAVRDEHVIDIHAVCGDGPVPYLVMEFIDGCNLAELLRRGGPLAD